MCTSLGLQHKRLHSLDISYFSSRCQVQFVVYSWMDIPRRIIVPANIIIWLQSDDMGMCFILRMKVSMLGFPFKRIATTGANMQESWGLDPYLRWSEMVKQFSVRNLAYKSDVLPALSGIAREFSMITKDTYISGMWKSYLLASLLWKRKALRIYAKLSESKLDL